MKWVSEHLQLIIAIAGAVAWWLTQRKQSAEEVAPPPPEEKTFEDPELADRTRQIREEIQRRIEQRARGHAKEPPPPARPEPADFPPVIRELFEESVPPSVIRPSVTRFEAQRQAEILEEQATLAERLREAAAQKVAAQKRTVFEAATADHKAGRRTEARAMIMGDLRTPQALRRAFILREVLGPPVGLK